MTDATARRDPPLDEVVPLINSATGEDYISLIGLCRVEYRGRTATTLEAGDRHIVVKPDGTLLVHLIDGQQPKNYQKPGADITARMTDEDTLHLHSEKQINADTADRETVDIEFDTIHTVSRVDMTDDGDFVMRGSEEDVQEHLMEHPDPISDALDDPFVPDEDEYVLDAAGQIDIFGHLRNDDGTVVVCELKRRRGGPDVVQQLRRYVDEVRRTHDVDAVRGVLVAPSLTDSAHAQMDEYGFTFVQFDPDDAVTTSPGDPNQSLDEFL